MGIVGQVEVGDWELTPFYLRLFGKPRFRKATIIYYWGQVLDVKWTYSHTKEAPRHDQ